MVLASSPGAACPLLWAPTSPITVLANHLARRACPSVMGPDLGHNCASQPQYC